MLVLTRKTTEAICIGNDIEIIITEINKNAVRIGVRAPKDTLVYRKEVYERILLENQEAAMANVNNNQLKDISKLLNKRLKVDG